MSETNFRRHYWLPFDMQIEIIRRLPVKSLVVFRSVSKAWKSIIDSPTFIGDHNKLRQHHRILVRYNVGYCTEIGYNVDFKCASIMDDDTLSLAEFDTVSNIPKSIELLENLELFGTSQGLLCFLGISAVGFFTRSTAVIWNPSLRKSIVIDVPDLYSGDIVLGFGVRPDNYDPMIVMISRVIHHPPVTVFTLSSRVWRLPRGNLLPQYVLSGAITDDRCIYWQGLERSNLVAFDMVNEDFMEIDLPASIARRDISISKIKESLALLEYDDDTEKPVYSVWIMVEDGVSKSFTKLFTINTPDAPLDKDGVLGFRKNCQPIMKTTIDEDGYLESLEVFEPHTGSIKNVGIIGEHGSFFVCSYTETLLLLDQLDEQFVEIQLQF